MGKSCQVLESPKQLRLELARLVNDQADTAEMRTLKEAERRVFEERQKRNPVPVHGGGRARSVGPSHGSARSPLLNGHGGFKTPVYRITTDSRLNSHASFPILCRSRPVTPGAMLSTTSPTAAFFPSTSIPTPVFSLLKTRSTSSSTTRAMPTTIYGINSVSTTSTTLQNSMGGRGLCSTGRCREPSSRTRAYPSP